VLLFFNVQLISGPLIFTELLKEMKRTTNTQGNTQQKEQCWRYHNTRLQTILQSNSNKNSMLLAEKQT
jgi:hypothetical protein